MPKMIEPELERSARLGGVGHPCSSVIYLVDILVCFNRQSREYNIDSQVI